MMEVHAAPSLQLFSGRGGVGGDGRASPLSRSVEDISSQLDRLTRTFHVASPPQATSPLPTTAAATFHSDARQADRATFHGGFGGCGAGGGGAAAIANAYPPASPSAAAHNTYGRSRENSIGSPIGSPLLPPMFPPSSGVSASPAMAIGVHLGAVAPSAALLPQSCASASAAAAAAAAALHGGGGGGGGGGCARGEARSSNVSSNPTTLPTIRGISIRSATSRTTTYSRTAGAARIVGGARTRTDDAACTDHTDAAGDTAGFHARTDAYKYTAAGSAG